jgi:hypothetical protein
MADVPTTDLAFRLAEVISKTRDSDKDFRKVMGSIDTALAEAVELLEESPKANSAALAEAFGKALKEAIAGLPAPTVHAPITVQAASWKTLTADVVLDPLTGRISRFVFTRS